MFIMFEGTPGSGKTYEAAIRIVDNLRLGRTIYTNIDGMNENPYREQIKYLAGLSDYELETQLLFVPEHELKTFFLKTKTGSFIVLDEVHKYFSNRSWSSEENTNFNKWASTHRHSGHDVLLLSQGIEKIDAHIRGLIEWTYRFKKNNMFGSIAEKSYKMTAYYQDDTSKAIDRAKIKTYQKKYFGCYKSYISSDVKELKIMPNVNILRHPIFFIIPLVLCFTLYMVFFKSSFAKGDLFGAKDNMKKYEQMKKIPLPNDKNVPGIPYEEIVKPAPAVHQNISPVTPKTGVNAPVLAGIGMDTVGETRKYCGFVMIDDIRREVLCKARTNEKTGGLTSFE